MNGSIPRDERLLELAAAQCDGALTTAEHAELERVLSDDTAAQRTYLRYLSLHAELTCSDQVLRATGMREAARRIEQLAIESEPAEPREAVAHAAHRLTIPRAGRWWPIGLAAALVMMPLLIPLLLVGSNWDRIAQRQTLATVRATGDGLRWATGETVAAAEALRAGTYHLRGGEATLDVGEAVQVSLTGPSVVRLAGTDALSLMQGNLRASVGAGGEGFEVETPTVRLVDRGTEFDVTVEPTGRTAVRVIEGLVDAYAQRRGPRVYISFDQPEGEIADVVTGGETTLMGDAVRVPGLVGSGAADVNNADYSAVYLGNGGGWESGTGAFAATTGVTVEALIVPRWSGKLTTREANMDYATIFRKDDQDSRILLSFQNDDGAERRTVPPVERGPTLAWGLMLDGDDYSEMEMPLDGRDGRPTLDDLRDGQPHHVVATFDSATGEKAIYIDGVKCFSHHFEPGMRIISGGGAPATVGNVYAARAHAFDGIIDEFAYYDYALTAEEVAAHYANVQRGQRYFDSTTTNADLATGHTIDRIRLRTGDAEVFE